MIPIPVVLLVLPMVGISLAASVVLARNRFPAWLAPVIALLSAIVPLVLFDRTAAGQSTGRTLWEWSAAGGPVVQAAYQVDDLALIGAAIVALTTGAAIHAIARGPSPSSLLIALMALNGIALAALVSMTDIVAGVLVVGSAAALAVTIALFVASASAAARLAALLALGVEAFIAAALLLARFGIAAFDLAHVPSQAISSGVLAAIALGAALFCGLYPFVPWRYEPRGEAAPLSSLRGVVLFPTGVAGSILALRVIAASGVPTTTLLLPEIPLATLVSFLFLIVALTALAVRWGPREARLRRAFTGSAFIVLVALLPLLHWSHITALLALLTVLYAAVASAAVVEEWQVARFDMRLGVLWAAIASGAPLALAGALFGLLASAIALALDQPPVPDPARSAIRTSARILVVFAPFFALTGIVTTPDLAVGGLCAAVLVIAGAVELAHAVREAEPADRLYATLASLAVTGIVGLLTFVPVVRAGAEVFAATPMPPSDLVIAQLGALIIALTVIVVALPRVVGGIRVAPPLVALVRRVLAATDPAPALALAYRGLEVWSLRAGTASATMEDRAGVWVATLLIALTLLWAASS